MEAGTYHRTESDHANVSATVGAARGILTVLVEEEDNTVAYNMVMSASRKRICNPLLLQQFNLPRTSIFGRPLLEAVSYTRTAVEDIHYSRLPFGPGVPSFFLSADFV